MTRVLSKTAPIGPARLELFDTLMSSLAPRGERKRNKERLRTLRDLDAAALVLRDVGRLVLDDKLPPGRIRKEAYKNIGQDTILAANTTVTELVQEDTSEETENWLEAVHVVTRFLPTLLSTLKFEGTPGMKPLSWARRHPMGPARCSRPSPFFKSHTAPRVSGDKLLEILFLRAGRVVFCR